MMPEPSTKPRRWPRFSLLTLMLFVAVCASGYGLWYRWEPWVVVRVLEDHPKHWITSCYFSPDGKRIVTASPDGRLRIWEAISGNCVMRLNVDSYVSSANFTQDSEYLVTQNGKGKFRYFNANSGVPLQLKKYPRTQLCWAQFSPDGLRFVSYDSSETPERVLRRRKSDRAWVGSRHPKHFVKIWNRRRPEYWWGVAWLPEFWLTLIFAAALAWSLWRDRRVLSRLSTP